MLQQMVRGHVLFPPITLTSELGIGGYRDALDRRREPTANLNNDSN